MNGIGAPRVNPGTNRRHNDVTTTAGRNGYVRLVAFCGGAVYKAVIELSPDDWGANRDVAITARCGIKPSWETFEPEFVGAR